MNSPLHNRNFINEQEEDKLYQYLLDDIINKLSSIQKSQKKLTEYSHTQNPPLAMLPDTLIQTVSLLIEEYRLSKRTDAKADCSPINLRIFNHLRTLYAFLGTIATSTEYQSPSYAHSQFPMAGMQCGTIIPSFNDYHRDHSPYSREYEQAFIREFLPKSSFLRPPVAYLTSSGMAAFTTIMGYLQNKGYCNGTILVGFNAYFECIELLKGWYPKNVIFFNEQDADYQRLFSMHHPTAIICDTIGNSPSMTVLDLNALLTTAHAYRDNPLAIVLDTTVSTVQNAFTARAIQAHKRHPVIAWESILKFHEYGLDRANAGIIWGYGQPLMELFDFRGHMGTMVPDATAFMIPTPDANQFRNRHTRLIRNTEMLAKTLSDIVSRGLSKFVCAIHHPSLPDHPSHGLWQKTGITAPFFTLSLKPQYDTPTYYKRYVSAIIKRATREGIPLVAGTSFGFPITRLYPTALRSRTTRPFIRIAVGTENAWDLDRLAKFLTAQL